MWKTTNFSERVSAFRETSVSAPVFFNASLYETLKNMGADTDVLVTRCFCINLHSKLSGKN
jgi:hypothetical protein